MQLDRDSQILALQETNRVDHLLPSDTESSRL